MLVAKKFIFISLPRCASTSFMITCLKNNIPIEHYTPKVDNQLLNIEDWYKLTNDELADRLQHLHEPLHLLQEKFGVKHEIISIKRDKYERFLSVWKHIIDELYRINEIDIANKFTKLTTDNLFDQIEPNDIYNKENRYKLIKKFLSKYQIIKQFGYVENMLDILFTPNIELTNNNPNIIWFDINNLYELEKWVSAKLGVDFKLENTNSSKQFECKIEINNHFKQKYDNLYKEFEERKLNKTLV
jgi:hypothetical protein